MALPKRILLFILPLILWVAVCMVVYRKVISDNDDVHIHHVIAVPISNLSSSSTQVTAAVPSSTPSSASPHTPPCISLWPEAVPAVHDAILVKLTTEASDAALAPSPNAGVEHKAIVERAAPLSTGHRSPAASSKASTPPYTVLVQNDQAHPVWGGPGERIPVGRKESIAPHILLGLTSCCALVKRLKVSLWSVAKLSTVYGEVFDTVVVDDSSADATALLQRAGVRTIAACLPHVAAAAACRPVGLTASWNMLYRYFLHHTQYSIYFCSNNDVLVPPSVIPRMAEVAAATSAGIVAPVSTVRGAGHLGHIQGIEKVPAVLQRCSSWLNVAPSKFSTVSKDPNVYVQLQACVEAVFAATEDLQLLLSGIPICSRATVPVDVHLVDSVAEAFVSTSNATKSRVPLAELGGLPLPPVSVGPYSANHRRSSDGHSSSHAPLRSVFVPEKSSPSLLAARKLSAWNGFFWAATRAVAAAEYTPLKVQLPSGQAATFANLFNPANINVGNEVDLAVRMTKMPNPPSIILCETCFVFHYKGSTMSGGNRNDLSRFHKQKP